MGGHRARVARPGVELHVGMRGEEEVEVAGVIAVRKHGNLGAALVEPHVAVTVDELDGTLGRLAEKGIEPEKPPYSVREGGSRLCFVRDPDGYRIELIERPAG